MTQTLEDSTATCHIVETLTFSASLHVIDSVVVALRFESYTKLAASTNACNEKFSPTLTRNIQ